MTDRKQALQDLRDKVAAGKLSPRRLDAEIDAVLRRGTAKMRKAAPWAYSNFPTWQAKESAGCCEVVHTSGDGGLWWESDRFTTSLDAAKALNDAVLPERSCGIVFGGEYGATVTFPPIWDALGVSNSDKIPARAWVLSILDALIAKESV